MSDDLVNRVDSLMVLLNMERKKSLLLGKHIKKLEADLEVATMKRLLDSERIEKLEAALRKIADIEHEELPKPTSPAESTLWVILTGCVEVAEKALEGKDD